GGDHDRMRERDQRRRPLRGENAGDFRGGEDVALWQGPLDEPLQRRRLHAHGGDGDGLARGGAFGADVDHGDAAGLVEMGKVIAHAYLIALSSSSGVLTLSSGSPGKRERNSSSSTISAPRARPRRSYRRAAMCSATSGSTSQA